MYVGNRKVFEDLFLKHYTKCNRYGNGIPKTEMLK